MDKMQIAQICLLVWTMVGLVIMLCFNWASGYFEDDHDKLILVQMGIAVGLFWPLLPLYWSGIGLLMLAAWWRERGEQPEGL